MLIGFAVAAFASSVCTQGCQFFLGALMVDTKHFRAFFSTDSGSCSVIVHFLEPGPSHTAPEIGVWVLLKDYRAAVPLFDITRSNNHARVNGSVNALFTFALDSPDAIEAVVLKVGFQTGIFRNPNFAVSLPAQAYAYVTDLEHIDHDQIICLEEGIAQPEKGVAQKIVQLKDDLDKAGVIATWNLVLNRYTYTRKEQLRLPIPAKP